MICARQNSLLIFQQYCENLQGKKYHLFDKLAIRMEMKVMEIKARLAEILPENRIKTRLIDLVSYASDAGFYHLLPRALVQPINEEEIIALFRFSQREKIPVVFRAGGTSLSGQSITD